MNKRKAIAERMTNSHNLIDELLVELELRYLGCRKTDVEYSVVFNECFVLMETIRTILKRPKTLQYVGHPVHELEQDIDLVCKNLVKGLMAFTNKWSTPYTAWLSSYKSHAKNRHLFTDGNSESYLTYQCNFPKLEVMSRDFEDLQLILKSAVETLNNRKGAFYKGDFICLYFAYATGSILFRVLNFFKIRKISQGR